MENLEDLIKEEEILKAKFHESRLNKNETDEDMGTLTLELIMDFSALVRLFKDKKLITNEEIVQYRIKILKSCLEGKEGFEGWGKNDKDGNTIDGK